MRAALLAALLLAAAGCAARGGLEQAPPADEARQQAPPADEARQQPPPADEVRQRVHEAERLVAARAYAPATRLLEDIVRRLPDAAVQDRALYALGRVLVLPDNPGRNYRQALTWFDRLAREHPASPHAPDARAWRTLLAAYLARTDEIERLKQVDLQLERARRP